MPRIKLSNGITTVLVDRGDLERVSSHVWHRFKNGKLFYARGVIDGKSVQMHRLILGLKNPRTAVDHKDGDGLNNRRLNLRVATKSQNGANTKKYKGTSRHKGVSWDKRIGRWRAQLTKTVAGKEKQKYLGCYENEDDAAIAYNAEALKAFGEFALLNKLR